MLFLSCFTLRFHFSSSILPSICWNPIFMTNNETHSHSITALCSCQRIPEQREEGGGKRMTRTRGVKRGEDTMKNCSFFFFQAFQWANFLGLYNTVFNRLSIWWSLSCWTVSQPITGPHIDVCTLIAMVIQEFTTT